MLRYYSTLFLICQTLYFVSINNSYASNFSIHGKDSGSISLTSLESDSNSLIKVYAQKTFTKNKWISIVKDLNYSKDILTSEKKVDEKSGSLNLDFLKTETSKIIFFTIIILILIFIAYSVIKNSNNIAAKLASVAIINEDNLDEHLIVADLNKLLLEAIEFQNFKLALRIYFLMIIKSLHGMNRIEWKKDKTNRDYLFEMSLSKDYISFKRVTLIFDKVWYSNLNLDYNQYSSLKPFFVDYLFQLNSNTPIAGNNQLENEK